MKEILKSRSTNGRWGLSVVSSVEDIDLNSPVQGELRYLGKFEGFETYQITPAETGIWYLFTGEVKAIAGANMICSIGLQSSRTASIVALGEFGVVRTFGYKGRSSRITAYRRGEKVALPASVLAAMGLLPTPEAAPVIPEIPALEGELAAALKAAGLS